MNPFRYCGEYFDKETGSIYLRARYYDPATSRMLSEDPARHGLNWYSYCFNNPVNFIDPSGLKYVPLRSTIEGLGGTVSWDEKSGQVTATLDGQTVYMYNGDGNGNFIQNDLMYSDDTWLFMALATTFDLGKGWSGRIERDSSGGRYDKHAHVYKGNEAYAQNEDGSPHDGSKGGPPSSVKKDLKKQKSWDWDAKENDWANKTDISMWDNGDVTIKYPNGRQVTVVPYRPMGLPNSYYWPSRNELIEYYTGPIYINKNAGNSNGGTVPVLPMPNPVPVPVPAPMPVPIPAF